MIQPRKLPCTSSKPPWSTSTPYGEVKLNMTRRIARSVAQTAETDAEPT
jgi:hypothetical protein